MRALPEIPVSSFWFLVSSLLLLSGTSNLIDIRTRNHKPTNQKLFYSSSEKVNFSTSKKLSSTGVERPKIVTITFSTPLSGLISST